MNGWTLVGLLGKDLSHVNPQNALQFFKEILYSVFRLVFIKITKTILRLSVLLCMGR